MTALLAAAAIASADILVAFAEPRWRAQPQTRIEDAYKWLFHATLGGEHAVREAAGPRAWLDREWATLEVPRQDEPEITPLRPDRRIVRINLRPFKARGGDKEMLLAVFLASAERFDARHASFVEAWNALRRRLEHASVGRINLAAWHRLEAETRPAYPAIHHSPEYEKAHKPAYRVVLGELWMAPGP